MARKLPADASEFAKRLFAAIDYAGTTQTKTESDAKLPRGYISQVKSGKIRQPGTEKIKQITDALRVVSFEWLARGNGSMRVAGAARSPLEDAQLFARRHGVREDAIAAAEERHAHDEPMSGVDWIIAFDAEERRLERAGVPAPHVLIKRRKQLAKEMAELDAPRPPSSPPKVRRRRSERSA